MKAFAVVETTFSGSHTVLGHPRCGERHGHVWKIRIELATDEKALVAGSLADITALIRQFSGHDLDRYVPGVELTCEGLSRYFRERLSEYPVSAIEMFTEDGYGARVEWSAR